MVTLLCVSVLFAICIIAPRWVLSQFFGGLFQYFLLVDAAYFRVSRSVNKFVYIQRFYMFFTEKHDKLKKTVPPPPLHPKSASALRGSYFSQNKKLKSKINHNPNSHQYDHTENPMG